MKEVSIHGLKGSLLNEVNSVRVIFPGENIILPNQTIDNVEILLKLNFEQVHSYYKIREEESNLTDDDLNYLSIKIVLYYLYMYNMWQIQYKAKSYQNLNFKEKDFQSTSTYDLIFSFLQKAYKDDWKDKAAGLLNVTPEQLDHIYTNRTYYYNR